MVNASSHLRNMVSDIKTLARGHWPYILDSHGIEVPPSPSKHGPCPCCGGKDRFRFDNKDGNGSHICSQCGAGDGFELLMKYYNWRFPQAVKAVSEHLGVSPPNQYPRPRDKRELKTDQPAFDFKKQSRINETLAGADKSGPSLTKYLNSRGLGSFNSQLPNALKLHSGLPYWQQQKNAEQWEKIGIYPAMLGEVTDINGEIVTLHRTYLTPDGNKAPVPSPKKLMSPALPGSLKGSSIKLGHPNETLYLTEGIETALAVMAATGEPVWACVSAKLLEQVIIPDSVNQVYIMADKDRSKTGELSARKLALRLLAENESTSVKICVPPEKIPENSSSIDWLDVYQGKHFREYSTDE